MIRPSTLLAALQSASPEEVAAALLEASKTRNGLAYDVGMALYEANASKEIPGPNPDSYEVKRLDVGDVYLVSYDPLRLEDAIVGYRIMRGLRTPTFDPTDPKWLKATRAERRLAERTARDYRDPAPDRILLLNRRSYDGTETQVCTRAFGEKTPSSRAEAEAEVAEWLKYGIVAKIEGYGAPDAFHTVSLGQLSAGPC